MGKMNLALRLRNLFAGPSQSETFLEELEDMLVEGDVGIHAAMESVDELKSVISQKRTCDPEELLNALKEILKRKGRLTLIYPSVRLPDIFSRLKHYGFEPKRLRINHQR